MVYTPWMRSGDEITIEVNPTLDRLLEQEDTDGDGCITILDRGPGEFEVVGTDGRWACIQGTYQLSGLLQELGRASLQGLETIPLDLLALAAPASHRVHQAIRRYYWEALTRRITRESIAEVAADPKVGGPPRLYLPANDTVARRYYQPDLLDPTVEVHLLPADLSPSYCLQLNSAPGLLGLNLDSSGRPTPYVVPGGRFNEMYGWDSYFIALGLMADDKVALVASMAGHLIYQIEHYGAILNANRTYYLTRSQPPFLTSFLRLLKEPIDDKSWLERGLRAAIKEYDEVWMGPSRLTPCGLSRYHCAGIGYPPETLPRHYGTVLQPFAQAAGLSVEEYRKAYLAREVESPELDRYFEHDRAVRESGHDTSYRLESRAAELCTVDLNSLLYRYEVDIAALLEQEFGGSLQGCPDSSEWRVRARRRQDIMNSLCWREGGFFDYNYSHQATTDFVSATNLYPLWAGLASPDQARVMLDRALPELLQTHGVAGSSLAARGPLGPERTARQWDFPFGWAPHQMLLWQGLQDYGYTELASDLAFRWVRMLTRCAKDFNGVLAEKYDVVSGSHQVFAEYGNQGSEFRLVPREGFGWTNASFQVGLTLLSEGARAEIDR